MKPFLQAVKLGFTWNNVRHWLAILLILAWTAFIICLWVMFWKSNDLLESIKIGVLLIVLSMFKPGPDKPDCKYRERIRTYCKHCGH